ncbi:acyl-CoA thioesterase [Candidatus Magnetominusculus dajiuhuensis]|uniref:acyl-CoA thioesterase n=1 Tax=Candidatus Magnetominusculus dajiuhuensis TaxID=3137712 RepID=UPI003B4309B7
MADTIDIRIYYEDTDCGGVVYYGKYMGFLERARTDFLERRGIRILDLMNEGTFFVVVGVDIRYHKPARYADIITIHTEIEEITVASITFSHKIYLNNPETKISTAKTSLAIVGTEMKPKRIPKDMIEALRA